MIFLVFCFVLWAISGSVQGLFLALCLGITPGGLGIPKEMPGIKLRFIVHMANALPTVQWLKHHDFPGLKSL